MNDDKLVRLADVLAALEKERGEWPSLWTRDAYGEGHYDGAQACIDAVSALPAAAPRPMGEARDLPPGAKVLAWWPVAESWVTTAWEDFTDVNAGLQGFGWVSIHDIAAPDEGHAPTHFLPHPETPE